MSAVTIEISHQRASRAPLITDVFLGPFAGRIMLAAIAGDAHRNELLDAEALEPELLMTRYTAAPITSQIAALDAKQSRSIKVWCAVRAGLPVAGEAIVASYLRFAIPEPNDPEKIARFVPLCELEVGERTLTFSFPVDGAPFLPPRSVDDGGELDQAWSSSAAVSRGWLSQAVAELRKNTALKVRITGLDAFPS